MGRERASGIGVVVLVTVTACSTSLERCTVQCSETAQCPRDWSCLTDGICHPVGDYELCRGADEPGEDPGAGESESDAGTMGPGTGPGGGAVDGAPEEPSPDGGADAVVVEPCAVTASGAFEATRCDCGDETCATWIKQVRGVAGGILRVSDDCNPAGEVTLLGIEVTGTFNAGRCDCGDGTCASSLTSVSGEGNLLRFRNGCDEGADLVLTGAVATGSFTAGQCDCGDSTCATWVKSVRASGNALVFANGCGSEGTIAFACAP